MIIHDPKHTVDPNADAYEQGHELFKAEPELLGAEVWWRATEALPVVEDQFNFVAGYMQARRQKDDYEREKKGVEQPDSEGGSGAQCPDDHDTVGSGDGG